MNSAVAVKGGTALPLRSSGLAEIRTRWHWARLRMAMRKSDYRVEVYERLQTFTGEKQPLDTILRAMLDLTREKGHFSQVMWDQVAKAHINDSVSFATAMAPFVPAAERVMIGVGETTGRMSEGLQEALFVCTAAGRVGKELKKALLYPVLLVLGVIGLLLVIAFGIAPELENMLDRPLDEWPFFTWLMYQLGQGVISYGPWIAAAATVFGIVVASTMSRWTGRVRGWLDRYIPPYTIYREYQASGFLIALAALVRAKRPVDTAIADINAIATPWLKAHLGEVHRRLMDSQPPGAALDTGLLSEEVAGYILSFERMGAFRKGLNAVGVRGVDRSVARVAGQAAVVRWALTFLVVGLMGLVYVGMMQPGYVIYTESRQGGAIR